MSWVSASHTGRYARLTSLGLYVMYVLLRALALSMPEPARGDLVDYEVDRQGHTLLSPDLLTLPAEPQPALVRLLPSLAPLRPPPPMTAGVS